MTYGNKPSDDGNLILTQEERDEMPSREPFSVITISENGDGAVIESEVVAKFFEMYAKLTADRGAEAKS